MSIKIVAVDYIVKNTSLSSIPVTDDFRVTTTIIAGIGWYGGKTWGMK